MITFKKSRIVPGFFISFFNHCNTLLTLLFIGTLL